jgi:hypothetical protein
MLKLYANYILSWIFNRKILSAINFYFGNQFKKWWKHTKNFVLFLKFKLFLHFVDLVFYFWEKMSDKK